jgi:hypothetical protein
MSVVPHGRQPPLHHRNAPQFLQNLVSFANQPWADTMSPSPNGSYADCSDVIAVLRSYMALITRVVA